MLSGECFTVRGGRNYSTGEPLNETAYWATQESMDKLILLTIGNALAGLVLNILSLVVFLRVFSRSRSRNNFLLFFVFLTICEIAFCLGSTLSYSIAMLSHRMRIRWVGFDPLLDENSTSLDFYYSTYLPTDSRAQATAFYLFLSFSNYLAVLSQFSRNCWVGLTALLRSYVATRRTSVHAGRTFSLGRVSGMFAAKVALVLALGGVRAYIKDAQGFLRPEFHVCNAANWSDGGLLLLHVPLGTPPFWHTVNMLWTLLSQIIPLLVILFSSIVLIVSLRRGNAMANSSERNKRVTRMVFIFALAFALLEAPRAALYLLEKFVRITDQSLKMRAAQVTYILSLADSTVNVFIYFFKDQQFRKELCQQGGRRGSNAGTGNAVTTAAPGPSAGVSLAAPTAATSVGKKSKPTAMSDVDAIELKPLNDNGAAAEGVAEADGEILDNSDDGTRV